MQKGRCDTSDLSRCAVYRYPVHYTIPNWRYSGAVPVIASFRDKGTEDVFNNEDTRAARKACPREIWKVAQRKLAMIEAAAVLTDMRVTPGNA